MPNDNDSNVAMRLPDDYAAVPLEPGQVGAALQVCVVVKRSAEPAGGRLVILRETFDARVAFGCVTDRGGQVHRWAEVWIQTVGGLADLAPACREALSNHILDERWRKHYELLKELDPDAVLTGGWETEHPPATFIDLHSLQPVVLSDAEGAPALELCRDDAALTAAGLSPYATTLDRYLHAPGAESPSFVRVTPEAPINERVAALTDVLAGRGELLPLNPEGGLMLVRTHCAIPYDRFVSILGGDTWDGVRHGRSSVFTGDPGEGLREGAGGAERSGRLFLGSHGRSGRLVEALHLKLCLLRDVAETVRSTVQRLKRPILNLKADSFRVGLGRVGCGLPALWTARGDLVDPGNAVVLPLPTAEAEYYLQAVEEGASVYWPAAAGLPVRGRSTVRIRSVQDGKSVGTVIEGTFLAQERINLAASDLIWLRLNLGEAGRVDLYARLDEKKALAGGEWRFRTVDQKFAEARLKALRAAEGVPMPETPFEIIPLLSTPCDLYSLGVLAVQTLLVDQETTLPVALDEALSLIRQVAIEHNAGTPLRDRVRKIFDSDPRWAGSLGPNRLVREEISCPQALDLVPAELWWDVLAMLVRVFPGVGPDSACRDFGDAVRGGAHRVFDTLLSDLGELVVRTRSLIVIDWRFNREIHAVVRGYRIGTD